jgi:23S rRNA (pseudouridine1915-N3)-methyltransferase
MKRIHIRAVGHLPEAWQREAQSALIERLSPYFKLDLIEAPEGHRGSSKPDMTKTKRIESESLAKGYKDDAFVIAVDERGKEFDSPAFAKQLETWTEGGRPLIFLIGGSWGLDESLAADADAKLSLGRMTWPHAMARLLLLEQLFRAEAISRGKEYHK